jgi:hypothetical protein
MKSAIKALVVTYPADPDKAYDDLSALTKEVKFSR